MNSLIKQSGNLLNQQTSIQSIKERLQSRHLLDDKNDLNLEETTEKEFLDYFLSLKVLNKELSEHTVRAYHQDLRTIIEFFHFHKQSIKEIGFVEVKLFNQYIQDRYSNRTSVRKLDFFKRMLDFGYTSGFYKKDYSKWIVRPSVVKGHVSDKRDTNTEKNQNRIQYREISERESRLLLENLSKAVRSKAHQQPFKKRNILFGKLLLLTGMRSSEIVGLNWGSFREDRKGNLIVDVIGKGQKGRTIPVFEEVVEALFSYRQSLEDKTEIDEDDSTPLFYRIKDYYNTNEKNRISYTTLYRAIKSAVYLANKNEEISPHWFRHTFITESLSKDVPLAVVKQVAGHSSISTTNLYLERLQDESVHDAFRQSGFR